MKKFLKILWRLDGKTMDPNDPYFELAFSLRGLCFALAAFELVTRGYILILPSADAIYWTVTCSLALFAFYVIVFALRLIYKIHQTRCLLRQ